MIIIIDINSNNFLAADLVWTITILLKSKWHTLFNLLINMIELITFDESLYKY
jgi:hypothetical protein